ncbi:adenylate/guanylate cyclase domain-containing protein [Mesorhizobium sp. 10J20-29]
MMGADETGTFDALRRHRDAVFNPIVAAHGGRVFKIMGDGTLVEFASVVDAVNCAIDIQRTIQAEQPKDGNSIVLRIGINLGDVIVDGDDIYGDGVNVAARLEPLAEPGGICVSAIVNDSVATRINDSFCDGGEVSVKNIARPIKVWRWHPDQLATGKSAAQAGQPTELLREKPSIAVLPFVNMSGDADQEYFTDGLTEDIITDLSNVPGFFVIARNSTFAYKGKPSDVRQIARDLGVKYILEGSARRSDKRMRLNVQLANGLEGGNHVWAERFDRDVADIFSVQDEVTRRVVEAISGKLGVKNIVARARPSNLEAYDLCVRSRDKWNISSSDNRRACADLERAVQIDPNYCEAHSNLAISLLFGWIIWGEPQIPGRGKALMHAQRAVEIDPSDSHARRILGCVQLYERNWDDAKFQFDAAVRHNPNNADAVAWMGELQIYLGNSHDALMACAEALRLNPRPPGWYFWIMGMAQISSGQYVDAVASLSREETYGTGSREHLIAALALSGRLSEAQEEARLFIASNPNWKIGDVTANSPFKGMSIPKPFVDGWRLAGLPD